VKQAPAWNQVTQAFKDDDSVVFGDINLSEQQIRDIHGEPQNPGAGGWPTVRYFNKETGYGGRPYAKKTDKAMCDELGSNDYMQAYVEEAGGTTMCDVEKFTSCTDKESKFLEKWRNRGKEDIGKEHARLLRTTSNSKDMKPEAAAWARKRSALLKRLLPREEL